LKWPRERTKSKTQRNCLTHRTITGTFIRCLKPLFGEKKEKPVKDPERERKSYLDNFTAWSDVTNEKHENALRGLMQILNSCL
jgi:hypothetical protein